MKQQRTYAEIALNIFGILTLAPASSADQNFECDFGETHPCPLHRGFAILLYLLSTADEMSRRLGVPSLHFSFFSLCIKDILSLLVGNIYRLPANSFSGLLQGSVASFSVLLCPILPQSSLLSKLVVILLGVFGLESITQVNSDEYGINRADLVLRFWEEMLWQKKSGCV